jgi:hypothetical protein
VLEHIQPIAAVFPELLFCHEAVAILMCCHIMRTNASSDCRTLAPKRHPSAHAMSARHSTSALYPRR